MKEDLGVIIGLPFRVFILILLRVQVKGGGNEEKRRELEDLREKHQTCLHHHEHGPQMLQSLIDAETPVPLTAENWVADTSLLLKKKMSILSCVAGTGFFLIFFLKKK